MEGAGAGGAGGAGAEQQFCLRWNNFQANITSQFEALREDEELVDVTLAVEGARLEAHKVVLSACSPYFKDLFKNNPCPHPIIFMRDCELAHIRALLQFMYAGQVNIAQAQLSAFLRTADALQIRGLTDSSNHNDKRVNRKSPPSQLRNLLSAKPSNSTSSSKAACQNIESSSPEDQDKSRCRSARSSTENNDDTAFQTSSQMRPNNDDYSDTNNYPSIRVKTDLDAVETKDESENMDMGEVDRMGQEYNPSDLLEPKLEVMERDYEASDEERAAFPQMYYPENNALANPFAALAAQGNLDLLAGLNTDLRDENMEASGGGGAGVRCAQCGRRYSNASNLRQHVRLIHQSQPVLCGVCGRSFKTPLYLRRHTLAQHPVRRAPPQPPDKLVAAYQALSNPPALNSPRPPVLDATVTASPTPSCI